MTPQQALNNLNAAAAVFNGTREQHDVLLKSISILQSMINPPDPVKED